jgi:hypothetical protein
LECPINENSSFNLGDALFNKLGKHILAYLPAKILLAIIAFISVQLITMYFEPSDYSTYTLLVSGTTLIALIFQQTPIKLLTISRKNGIDGAS